MSWKKTEMLMDTIKHYASFPATGVSLRQMVQFGERPSTGTVHAVHSVLPPRLMGVKYRNLVPRFPIPFRRAPYPTCSPCSRAWRLTRWPQRNALNHKSTELVRTVIRRNHAIAETKPHVRGQGAFDATCEVFQPRLKDPQPNNPKSKRPKRTI